MTKRLEKAFDRMANCSAKKMAASAELDKAFYKKYGVEYGEFVAEHPSGDEFVECYEYAAGTGFSLDQVDAMVAEFIKAREIDDE